MARYCPDCGANVNAKAKYCHNCGILLPEFAPLDDEANTATYIVDEHSGELTPVSPDKTSNGALVIRAGGERIGESFPLNPPKMTIGRSPEADVFLDDVTVSRTHAMLCFRGEGWDVDDAGSLNGTYVNRKPVSSIRLEDGDELQIGKFRLTFYGHGQ